MRFIRLAILAMAAYELAAPARTAERGEADGGVKVRGSVYLEEARFSIMRNCKINGVIESSITS